MTRWTIVEQDGIDQRKKPWGQRGRVVRGTSWAETSVPTSSVCERVTVRVVGSSTFPTNTFLTLEGCLRVELGSQVQHTPTVCA